MAVSIGEGLEGWPPSPPAQPARCRMTEAHTFACCDGALAAAEKGGSSAGGSAASEELRVGPYPER